MSVLKNHLLLKIALTCLLFAGSFNARAQCPDITGFYSVCLGSSTNLSNTSPGGAWSSSSGGVATVNSSGVVFSVSAGTTVISYTAGCGVATQTVTVQTAAPGAITGTVGPCVGAFAQVANSVGGGVWSSSNPAVFNINAAGVIASYAIGSANITYSTGCGSPATRAVSFTSQSPLYIYGATVDVMAAAAYLCIGATTTLSNDGIPTATWSSNNPSVATVNATTGVVTSVGGAGTTTITASNICSFVSRYVNLKVANPTAIAGNLTICGTGSTVLSNGTHPGRWSSGNTTLATVNPLSGEVYATGAGAGSVPITYTYAGGCSVTSALTISPAVPVISGNAGVCVASTITLSSGSAGGTWTSGNASVATVSNAGVVTGVSLGNAVITYTTACGFATHTVAVAPSPGPIGGPDPTNSCTPYFVQLTNSVAGGVWSSSNTNVGVISSGGALTGSSPGSVIGSTVVTYSTGCGAVSTRTITTTSSAPTTIYGFTTPAAALHLCPGAMITLSNDGIPTGTWSSNNTAVVIINSINGVITTAGLGAVIVTARNICGGRGLNIVVEAPTPIAGNLVMCGTTTTTLSNGTPLGTWSSGNTSLATIDQNGVVRAVPGGGYGVVPITYTLLGGCSTNTTVLISATPSAIAGSRIICVGSTITMSNSSPGGTWSSAATGIATVNSTTGVVTGVAAGTAVISYANACGAATATVTVGGTAATPIYGNLLLCGSLTTTLSNSSSPGTWSSGNTSLATIHPVTGVVQVVPGGGSGTVPIAYTAAGACSAAMATLTVTVSMSVIGGLTNICTGSSVPLSNASPNGTWSSSMTSVATVGLNTGIVTGTGTGTTLITYTSPCGFTTLSITVGPLSPITGPSAVCEGATISLSNATGGGTFTSGSPGVASITPGGVLTGISSGSAIISYATGAGCAVTRTVTVIPGAVAGTITGLSAVCVGSTISLSNTVNGGTWSASSTGTATITSAGVLSGLATGVVTISYTVSNACSSAIATATVTVLDLPAAGVITGPDHVCAGSSVMLSNTVAEGGTWSAGPATVAAINTDGLLTGLAVGTATISYTTLTNSCGSAMTTFTVTVDPTPSAGTITGSDSLCKDVAFSLAASVSGGVWSSSNVAVATVVNTATGSVRTLTAGVAIISYSVGNGTCVGVATHSLTVVPIFTLNASVAQVSCYGANDGNITVSIASGAALHNYLWSTGSTSEAVSGLAPGVYILNVSEPATQCRMDTAFTITQPDSLITGDTTTADLCKSGNGTVTLTVSGGTPGYSYLWSNGAADAALQNLHSGVYTVTVTDQNSCVAKHMATVADSACSIIVLHDVITPNGDGYNDTWVIEGITGYPNSSVQIFDKWGDAVFEAAGYKNDWGGQGKKGSLPDGTYYYLIKLNSANFAGGNDTFTGTIMIKR